MRWPTSVSRSEVDACAHTRTPVAVLHPPAPRLRCGISSEARLHGPGAGEERAPTRLDGVEHVVSARGEAQPGGAVARIESKALKKSHPGAWGGVADLSVHGSCAWKQHAFSVGWTSRLFISHRGVRALAAVVGAERGRRSRRCSHRIVAGAFGDARRCGPSDLKLDEQHLVVETAKPSNRVSLSSTVPGALLRLPELPLAAVACAFARPFARALARALARVLRRLRGGGGGRRRRRALHFVVLRRQLLPYAFARAPAAVRRQPRRRHLRLRLRLATQRDPLLLFALRCVLCAWQTDQPRIRRSSLTLAGGALPAAQGGGLWRWASRTRMWRGVQRFSEIDKNESARPENGEGAPSSVARWARL